MTVQELFLYFRMEKVLIYR